MSNTETRPAEVVCDSGPRTRDVDVIPAREVPLGGLRDMVVRRTLPSRTRTLIGAWCFADHYGPNAVGETGGMVLPPHPHTGLATVSWLFAGALDHRDSAGFQQRVRPGEINLMTAGRGISHSEYSTPETTVLHGAQLWVALPEAARFTDPDFEHYAPPELRGDGWRARVFLGSALGSTSPVRTHTELLGAELCLDPGVTMHVDVDPEFEHGVLVDAGQVSAEGQLLRPADLGYLPPGRPELELGAGEEPVRLLLLGGTPFPERLVMWWNFVGRSHEEIASFRAQWQEAIGEPSDDTPRGPSAAFQLPDGDPGQPLPAPELPRVRIRPRGPLGAS